MVRAKLFNLAAAFGATVMAASVALSDEVPYCFDQGSCWHNPWVRTEAARRPVQPKCALNDLVAVTSEEDFTDFLEDRTSRADACRKKHPMPPFPKFSSGLAGQQELKHFVAQNEDKFRKALACSIGPEVVDQIIKFPAQRLGTNDDPLERELNKWYLDSRTFERCDAAYSLLLDADKGTECLSRESRKFVFDLYRESCFEKMEPTQNRALNRLVFLAVFKANELRQVYCSGLVVAPGMLLTAKHCLVEPSLISDFYLDYDLTDTDQKISNVRLKRGTRIIAPFLEPYVFEDITILRANAAASLLAYYPNKPADDFIYLGVLGLGKDMAPITLDSAKKWDRLTVVGVLPDEKTLRNASVEGPEALARTMIDQMVVDNRPSCYVAGVQQGCLLHQCQTFSGFSGAPIFKGAYDDLRLVGVHSGFLGLNENVCAFRRSSIIRNRAVDINAPRD